MKRAKQLATWIEHVKEHWDNVQIDLVEKGPLKDLQVGEEFNIQVRVHLGNLDPTDVEVILYLGPNECGRQNCRRQKDSDEIYRRRR